LSTTLLLNLRLTTRKSVVYISADGIFIFRESGVVVDGSFTLREWGFWTLCAPVTLTLTRWPYIRVWPVLSGDILDVQIWTYLLQGFRKLLCDRQTDK